MKRTRLDGLPRMRGDRPVHYTKVLVILRFTPHARGSTPCPKRFGPAVCVYPACAGIDPFGKSPRRGRRSLPRMRGDRPSPCCENIHGGGFTPHARGSTACEDF